MGTGASSHAAMPVRKDIGNLPTPCHERIAPRARTALDHTQRWLAHSTRRRKARRDDARRCRHCGYRHFSCLAGGEAQKSAPEGPGAEAPERLPADSPQAASSSTSPPPAAAGKPPPPPPPPPLPPKAKAPKKCFKGPLSSPGGACQVTRRPGVGTSSEPTSSFYYRSQHSVFRRVARCRCVCLLRTQHGVNAARNPDIGAAPHAAAPAVAR